MNTKGVSIEWTIVDDEPEWAADQAALVAEEPIQAAPTTKAARLTEKGVALLAVMLFLILFGGWLWEKEQRASRTASELQTALMQKSQTATAPPASDGAAPLSADVASSRPRGGTPVNAARSVQVERYQRFGNRIIAQTIVSYPVEGQVLVYRESHFLQMTANGWVRIDPDPALMGPLQRLETAHFMITYRAVDVHAVHEAAPKLEEFYAKLRRDFGLPVANDGAGYTVELVADEEVQGYRYHVGERHLSVPSPSLLSAPVEMSAATVLYQSLVAGVAQIVVAEVDDQLQAKGNSNLMQWHPLANALRLRAVWAEGGPLAESRAEVVRWLFARPKDDRSNSRPPLPAGYDALCRSYAIWRMAPSDLFVPLACSEEDSGTAATDDFSAESAWKQERFNLDTVTLQDAFDSTVAVETILAYVVAEYGRESLPLLLAALGEHTSLDTLIPALFDVSCAEFEAGWKAYLAEEMDAH